MSEVDKDRGPIVLLASDCATTRILFHALTEQFGTVEAVIEQPMSHVAIARRRVKRLGFATVLGQLLFSAIAVPVLRVRDRKRIMALVRRSGMDTSRIAPTAITNVPSVNSPAAIAALRRLSPRVVVISGTRIIGRATLTCVSAPFINMHAGITPQYRGVHGGYWALVEGRRDLVGTTVHLVDTGIDTGPILGQATFATTRADSFATYPILHTAAGLPLLLDVVDDVLAGRSLVPRAPLARDEPSKLRHHPTLWGYLATRHRRSVG
jgi:phosphoribosylglycinamide formyltransferase-1